MIVTTQKLFEAAYGKYAIGAYNINNLEQAITVLACSCKQFYLFGGKRSELFTQQHVGRKAYGGERRFQLVRDRGDETALDFIQTTHASDICEYQGDSDQLPLIVDDGGCFR